MSDIPAQQFSHNHPLLTVRGCRALLDVLAFEGDEALSEPFRYQIEFTSADKTYANIQYSLLRRSLL